MVIGDFIAIGVILLVVGGAVIYILKAKKSGKKCIGCPDSATCGGSCKAGCGSCDGGCSSGKSHGDNKR